MKGWLLIETLLVLLVGNAVVTLLCASQVCDGVGEEAHSFGFRDTPS